MQTYNLNYHKNSTLLFFMFLVPISLAATTLFILLNISEPLSEYFFILVIAASLLLMVLLLRWVVYNKIIIPTKVELNPDGIFFELKKTSFLYNTTSFFASWQHVENISEIFCSKTGKYFYRITFSNPNFTANFSAWKNHEDEAEKFFNDVRYYRDAYSLVRPKMQEENRQSWAHLS
ncbi:MAG: hypothetical protein EOP55_00755 [Sphingobacteriales bacterium]|nr:MAG: hypothetical protein EOP55_00755 [Sphingobacteriales bacterium]